MILVVGATGELGGRIARRLARGERVRALVRDAGAAGPLRAAGIEIAVGDLRRPATLPRALQGVRTVVTTANAVRAKPPDTIEAVDRRGTEALIEAAMAERVGRFVHLSAFGASADSPSALLRAKAAAEARLQASGIPATILRPDLFLESWVGGLILGPVRAGRAVTLPGSGERVHSFIALEDVAGIAASAAIWPEALGVQEFGGPEALSLLDIVERIADLVGRVVPVRHLRAGASLPGLPETVAQIAAGLDTYDSELDGRPLAERLGVDLTPVNDWLRRHLETT